MQLGAPVPFIESHFELKAIFEFCVYKMHVERIVTQSY